MATDPSKRRTEAFPVRNAAPSSDEVPLEECTEAVETFTFEVSAGKKPGLDGPTQRANLRRPRHRLVPQAVLATNRSKQSAQERSTEIEAIGLDLSPVVVIDRAERAPKTKRGKHNKSRSAKRRRVRYWIASVAVHVVVLILLSIYALPALQEDEDFGLSASAAPVEELDEFQEIEFDPTLDLESLEEELASELFDPGAATLGELSAESALSEAMGDTAIAADSLGDMGMLFGENGNGLSDLGIGSAGGISVSFFGATVEGKRILYMLDNSGSMQGGRMETMIKELLKSVESLNPKQQFYVLFYSDIVYPLGFPHSVDGFLRADKTNKKKLQQWLETVELCGGNAVDEAIAVAEAINPDVVFMLSDGRVRTTPSGRKYNLLLNSAGRRFALHTLGMGCTSAKYREQLQAISDAHGGTFREVQVQPAMVKLSKLRPRPYRTSKMPGTVWGTSSGW